jgi:hypothetical protein
LEDAIEFLYYDNIAQAGGSQPSSLGWSDFGGLAFLKGLGMGHAITHVLGAHYHMPHGRAAIYGLLCFVKANKETCKEQFIDMAQLLNRSNDLEEGLLEFYRRLNIPISLKAIGIPKDDLKSIAFYTSRDAVEYGHRSHIRQRAKDPGAFSCHDRDHRKADTRSCPGTESGTENLSP